MESGGKVGLTEEWLILKQVKEEKIIEWLSQGCLGLEFKEKTRICFIITLLLLLHALLFPAT